MTKYSYEFKLQVVQEYQSGPLGYVSLAKKHGLPHHSPILNWVSQYRRQGRKGLKPKQSKTVYPFNFKLNVLRFKQETGASYRETADLFGLSNPSVIANWKRKFLEEGTQGLKKSIGRPPKMVKKSKKHKKKTSDDTTERLKELEAENEYLKTEVAYLKKLKALRAQKISRTEQFTIIHELRQEGFSLKCLFQVSGLPESTYHYHLANDKQPSKDQALEELIETLFYKYKETYGYRRITSVLHQQGMVINHKKVQRIMKKLGLRCIKFWRKSRKYSSYKGTVGKIAKNRLKRHFTTSIPLQKLTTDITEFKCLNNEKLYLSPIMDLYNREILSFKMSKHPTLDLVSEPLHETVNLLRAHAVYRTTIHTDQGWHYQHQLWCGTLKKNKIFQSMSRKGNCLDNSPMENFFGILKQEMYYGTELTSYGQLKERVETYIDYYNNERIKEKLAGMSPVQYRKHASQLAA